MTKHIGRQLADLYRAIQADSKYRSTTMGNVFVPGAGLVQTHAVVLVGEAPGREEEKARAPFVGPAGQNLDALLETIGLSRERIFITNLIKYRPLTAAGGNRNPTRSESRAALPYLRRELQILDPAVVVCLGLSAARALLENPDLKMGHANGKLFDKDGLQIFVTYHPSPYNYRIPAKRKIMQEAFRALQKLVNTASSGQ